MKKLFVCVLMLALIVGLLPMTAFASTGNSVVQEHKRMLANERTDEYALSFYSLDLDAHDRVSTISIKTLN